MLRGSLSGNGASSYSTLVAGSSVVGRGKFTQVHLLRSSLSWDGQVYTVVVVDTSSSPANCVGCKALSIGPCLAPASAFPGPASPVPVREGRPAR